MIVYAGLRLALTSRVGGGFETRSNGVCSLAERRRKPLQRLGCNGVGGDGECAGPGPGPLLQM